MKRNRAALHFSTFIVAAVYALMLIPSAHAHVQQGQAVSFLTGLEHPISGLDHVLAMVAVGIWGAQLGNPAIWLLPIAFPMMMALGAMMGLIGMGLPGIEVGIAVSAIVLGCMILGEVRAHLAVAVIVVGFFALFHGHAHGTELPAGQSGLLYSMGFVVATGCLHGAGIVIGLIHRWTAGRLLLRGGGAVIAMMGVFFLYQAVV